jgi:hypothetical protein
MATAKSGKVCATTAPEPPVTTGGGLVVAEPGAVDGSETPGGQCQWSPCGSHSPDSVG